MRAGEGLPPTTFRFSAPEGHVGRHQFVDWLRPTAAVSGSFVGVDIVHLRSSPRSATTAIGSPRVAHRGPLPAFNPLPSATRISRPPPALGFRCTDTNGFVEPGQLKDLPVMLVQPVGQQSLLLALRYGSASSPAGRCRNCSYIPVPRSSGRWLGRRPSTGLSVGVHQDALGRAGDVALDVEDRPSWW